MRKKLHGTDIVANPHINSKIHVWNKEYSNLSDLLSKSGIGWNSTTSMVEADPHVRGIRFKTWSYYSQWLEIFGKDRATGENAVDANDLFNEMLRTCGPEQEGETGDKFIPVPSLNKSNKIIGRIVGLKVADKLKVCDLLVQNTSRLAFFMSLPEAEQDEYVWMLLDGRL
ncbi:hypothetical protein ACS0TY_026282 [Phlomoides rotata]